MAIDRLAYKLVMDHKQFTDGAVASRKELNLAKQVMFETQTPAQKYQKQIDSLGGLLRKGAITQGQYNTAVKQLKNPAESAAGSLGKQALAFIKLNPALVASAAATAAFATAMLVARRVVREVTEAISKQFEEVDRLGKLSTSLGIGTSELATFGLIAAEAGADLEGFNKALKTMQKNLGDAKMGTGEAKKFLDAFGLSAETLSRLRPEDQFLAITEAISKLPTQIDKASAANAIFGKGSQEILRLLSLTKDEFDAIQVQLEAYGFAISKVDASTIEAANDAWGRLSVIWEGLARTAAIELAPAVIVVAEEIAAFAKSGDAVIFIKAAFVGFKTVLIEVAGYLDAIVGSMMTINALQKFTRSTFEQLGGDVEGLARDLHDAMTPRLALRTNEFFKQMDDAVAEVRQRLNANPVEVPLIGGGGGGGGGFTADPATARQFDRTSGPGSELDFLFGGVEEAVANAIGTDGSDLAKMLDKLGLDTSGVDVNFTPLAGTGRGSITDDDLLDPLKNESVKNEAARFAAAVTMGSQEDIAIRAAASRQPGAGTDPAVKSAETLVDIRDGIEALVTFGREGGLVVNELTELPTI